MVAGVGGGAPLAPLVLTRVECSAWPEWPEPGGGADDNSLAGVCGAVLGAMKKADRYGTFAAPVPLELVPGYAEVISQPMDLGTMQAKVDAIASSGGQAGGGSSKSGGGGGGGGGGNKKRGAAAMAASSSSSSSSGSGSGSSAAVTGYASLAEFRRDLRLVIENCLTWNIEQSDFFNDAMALDKAAHGAYLKAVGGGKGLAAGAGAPPRKKSRR